MPVSEIFFSDLPDFVHGGEIEILSLCTVKDGASLFIGKELAMLVEQLKGVPLAGVVRSRQDDPAVRSGHRHGKLRRGSAGVTGFYDVNAAGDKGAADKLLDHLAANWRKLKAAEAEKPVKAVGAGK